MSNEHAQDEFTTTAAEIDDLLTILKAHVDNNFDRHPDELTWADVGDVKHIKYSLIEIVNFIENRQ